MDDDADGCQGPSYYAFCALTKAPADDGTDGEIQWSTENGVFCRIPHDGSGLKHMTAYDAMKVRNEVQAADLPASMNINI